MFDFPVLKKYKQNHEKIYYYTKVLGMEWLGQRQSSLCFFIIEQKVIHSLNMLIPLWKLLNKLSHFNSSGYYTTIINNNTLTQVNVISR